MVTIGCDIHLKTTTFTVLDGEGKKLMRKKIENRPEDLRAFVGQFDGPKQMAVEASYNWPVFYEQFKEQVDPFFLIHPRRFKAVVDNQAKNDKKDADLIAELTYLKYIPQAHAAEAPVREMRKLLRSRVDISAMISSLKNRIHGVINANTFYYERPQSFKSLFCKKGLAWLDQVKLPGTSRFLIQQLLDQIHGLETLRGQLDQKIQSLDFASEDMKFLQTVPGMNGKLFKYLVLAEIDNVRRFRRARNLIAYSGLIPKERSSGGRIRRGHLRTDVNHYLRWALLQAVLPAVLRDKGLRAFYRQVKAAHHSSAARIATARKLLRAIYYVLRDRVPYRMLAEFQNRQ